MNLLTLKQVEEDHVHYVYTILLFKTKLIKLNTIFYFLIFR